MIDIGFLIDRSGSMKKFYDKEKSFIKKVAEKFGLSESGMHGGVVTFSEGTLKEKRIPLNKYTDIGLFGKEVDKLPAPERGRTRIDQGLMMSLELFTTAAGSRPNTKKALFLVTDGAQNPKVDDDGNAINPAKTAERFHQNGIPIYALAVGKKINVTELEQITGSSKMVYLLNNFDALINDDFIKSISKEVCNRPANISKLTGRTGQKISNLYQ